MILSTFARIRLLVLVLTLLGAVGAGLAQPAVAGTSGAGHTHGSISCGTGYMSVSGATAQRWGTPGPGGGSAVFYRALAYERNGSSWVYSSATAWQTQYPSGHGTATFKPTGLYVYRAGYFAMQTEFQWYSLNTNGTIAQYQGRSVGWASGGYCTYR